MINEGAKYIKTARHIKATAKIPMIFLLPISGVKRRSGAPYPFTTTLASGLKGFVRTAREKR